MADFSKISQQALKKTTNSQQQTDNDTPLNYDIHDNPELKKAYEDIKSNVPAIFLTGGAGTGKSTFIKYLQNKLKEETGKNCIIIAPTGIAAVNVRGQTIHSFFKFPIGPFEEKDIKKQNKNPVVDHTDLIIVDEISMVSSWLLDRMDYALRLWCNSEKPFGGKQVLLIGDCFQLPPVNNSNDKDVQKFLKQWDNIFFFAAKVFENIEVEPIQLTKIYRQEADKPFINILNSIRTCTKGVADAINFLNEKCLIEKRLGTPNVPSNCLLLTTTNSDADKFNIERMNNLKYKGKESMTFKASKSGVFDADDFLTPETLELCIDATVMVTKNTSSGLINGNMGRVVSFDGKGDYVEIEIAGKKHSIQRETWQNFRYIWDEETKTIKQEVTGSFTQIPLKLGWAVTIHKSQGLTLDNVAIDAAKSWDSGQVYVPLSRARSLNGVLLRKEIPPESVKVDPYIKVIYEKLFPEAPEQATDNPKVDYSTIQLTNDHFVVDKTPQKTSVTIGGISFELFPKDGERIQDHVQRTMEILLSRNLIPQTEMDRLLTDEEYCYSTFGIHFEFKKTKRWIEKYTLLQKNPPTGFLERRYWKEQFSGYYICSQWYQTKCPVLFAQWLNNLSEGRLGTITQNTNTGIQAKTCIPKPTSNQNGKPVASTSASDKVPDWITNPPLRKKNIDKVLDNEGITAQSLRQHVHDEATESFLKKLHEKGKSFEQIQTEIKNLALDALASSSEKVLETIAAKRTPQMKQEFCVFVSNGGQQILALDEGNKNKNLPWTGKEVQINIYKRDENGNITKWSWEERS